MHFIYKLIDRFWSGSATPREKKSLLEALQKKEAELRTQHLEDFHETMLQTSLQRMSTSDRQRILDRIHKRIGAVTKTEETVLPKIKTRNRRMDTMWRMVGAAVLVLAVGSIIAIRQFQPLPKDRPLTEMASGMHRTTNSSGRMLSITLPDESIVHLAPGATIYHAVNFNREHRNIDLIGRAHFDVAKNPDLPFTVTSRGYTVTALGTIFLVDGTRGKHLRIALLEGKVSVRHTSSIPAQKADHILLPGEELLIDLEMQRFDKRQITSGNPHNDRHMLHIPESLTTTGKKKTVLHFEETPIATVIDQLEVLYGKKIMLDPKMLQDQRFTGRLFLGDGTSIDSLREILSELLKESKLGYRIGMDNIRIIDKETTKTKT